MKKIFCSILCLAVLSLNACKNDTSYKKVDEKSFSLEVPVYMSNTDNLNDDASLQMQNPVRELYIISIEDSREELQHMMENNNIGSDTVSLLAYYSSLLIQNYQQGIADYKQEKLVKADINGQKALVLDFTGSVNKHAVYYKVALIDGGDHFYQVMTWTLDRYRKKNKGQMEHMLQSFRSKSPEV